MLGVAYLYSLNFVCFFFLLAFSFSLTRMAMAELLPPAHRVWTMDGARNLGIDVAAGREVPDMLSLAIEAMH